MTRRQAAQKPDRPTALLPIAVDVDLIRFEKNLLQIGFFGANDARDKNRTSRRIEQTVFRDGHKVKVAAEFRGSEQLGLPSTTDRDKFIALLKIVGEERAKSGKISNPVRFSGYRMIQELGLSRNGEIYEEIVRWGKRMTDTTITSEQVVYRAAKKVYSDEVLHVFRAFKRTGSSNLNGSEKQEHYEVTLEDWLIENLNQRYVIPEDFNAYKQLTRPTAKGIFGNLHLWFHASQGRQVEKDYSELCNLLNVQVYPHLSKIKSTMGLALNELVKIKYISKWDVQSMTSKSGYKIVLTPGIELLRVLQNSRPEQREVKTPLLEEESGDFPDNESAVQLLIKHGIAPTKARQLAERYSSETIAFTVEYFENQVITGKRVDNPSGIIIWGLENNVPNPNEFVGNRRRDGLRHLEDSHKEKTQAFETLQLAYLKWAERKRKEALDAQYPGSKLQDRLRAIAKDKRSDPYFARVPETQHSNLAMQILNNEIREAVALPSFEEWRVLHTQINLF
jgi:Replication initiator protein A